MQLLMFIFPFNRRAHYATRSRRSLNIIPLSKNNVKHFFKLFSIFFIFFIFHKSTVFLSAFSCTHAPYKYTCVHHARARETKNGAKNAPSFYTLSTTAASFTVPRAFLALLSRRRIDSPRVVTRRFAAARRACYLDGMAGNQLLKALAALFTFILQKRHQSLLLFFLTCLGVRIFTESVDFTKTTENTATSTTQIPSTIQNSHGLPSNESIPNGSLTFMPKSPAIKVGIATKIVMMVRRLTTWFTLLEMTELNASIVVFKISR